MIRNNTEVISFRSDAVTGMEMSSPPMCRSFNSSAIETQALYTMEPMITAVVERIKPTLFNSWVPMITFARPMTMVPSARLGAPQVRMKLLKI